MKNVLQLSASTICIVGILFGSGIFINPSIIHNFQLWVVVVATIVMFGSQPKLSKADLLNPKDKFSMLGISLMAIIVTNVTVVEWSLKPSHQFVLNAYYIIGFLMILGGLAFRIYAIKLLSRYFSNAVTIQAEHQLVDKGIYAKIRHPSYTGAIITIIGTIVWFQSWVVLPFCLVLIFCAYSHRVYQEEKMLLLHFGEKYERYRARTGAFFPVILKWNLFLLTKKISFPKK